MASGFVLVVLVVLVVVCLSGLEAGEQPTTTALMVDKRHVLVHQDIVNLSSFRIDSPPAVVNPLELQFKEGNFLA
jgi:hypothetical protein